MLGWPREEAARRRARAAAKDGCRRCCGMRGTVVAAARRSAPWASGSGELVKFREASSGTDGAELELSVWPLSW